MGACEVVAFGQPLHSQLAGKASTGPPDAANQAADATPTPPHLLCTATARAMPCSPTAVGTSGGGSGGGASPSRTRMQASTLQAVAVRL